MKVETEDILVSIPINGDGGLQLIWEDNAVIQTENDGTSFILKQIKKGCVHWRTIYYHLHKKQSIITVTFIWTTAMDLNQGRVS